LIESISNADQIPMPAIVLLAIIRAQRNWHSWISGAKKAPWPGKKFL